MFTARCALSPNIKQIKFRLYKVNGVKTEVNSEKTLVHGAVSVFLGYDAASLGKSRSIFPRNVVVSSSRVETSKKILPEHFQKPITFSIVSYITLLYMDSNTYAINL